MLDRGKPACQRLIIYTFFIPEGHERVQQLAAQRPDFSLLVFQNVGVGWPWQEHAWLSQNDAVLVALTLDEANGPRVSRNIYGQGSEESRLQKLN